MDLDKTEYEYRVEKDAKECFDRLYKNKKYEGNTYLEKLVNYSVDNFINMYKNSSESIKAESIEQLKQSLYIKDNISYVNLYTYKMILTVETSKFGKEIYELLQKSKTSR